MTLALIGAVLTILAALAPAFARWVKSRQDKAADPETARQRRHEIADNDITSTPPGLAPDVSAHAIDDLDAFDRMRQPPRGDRPK